MLWIARTLSGSGEIPSLEKTNPKKDREDLLNSHFDLFRVRLMSANFWKTTELKFLEAMVMQTEILVQMSYFKLADP